MSCVSSSVSVANAAGGVVPVSLSAAVSAMSVLPTATTSTTVPAKNVKTVKPVKPVKPKNKNVASAVGTTVPVIAAVTTSSNISTGISGSVVVLPVDVVGLISVCVNKSTSVLRDTADNSCSSGSEVKVEWLDTGMSPKICVNNNNREMTLAQDGKCATKNSAVADVMVSKQILACADDKTGVLRYRASGVCGTNTDPVAWVLKDQGVARNVDDAVKKGVVEIISLIPTTGAAGDSSGSTKTVTTSPTTNTSSVTTTTIAVTTTAVPTATTTSSPTATTSTTTVALRAVGSFAGYLGGTCPDGSGIPWYWGSDSTARAGGCSAAASIAPTTTAPATTTTAVSATTVAPVVVPGTPATPTGVAGNTQVTVSVTAGSGGTPTSYTITQSTTSGGVYTTGCTVTGASGSCVVTGLTNGTAYFFKTTATNTAGTSSASTASSAVTPATVPDAPTLVVGTAGNTQVALTWTAPVSAGGSAITDYVVEYLPSGGSWTTFADGTSTSTSATVTGLTNATSYTFRVSATNSRGTSSLSSASASVTPAMVYVVGSTGPGGGIVFYVASGTFTQTSASGSMCTTACKYLEVAPQGWIVAATPAGQTNCGAAAGAAQGVDGTSTLDPSCMWSTNMTTTYGNSSGVIGAGYANTLTLLAAYNVVGTAAKVARAYQGGGLTDWFLPSQNELTEIYTRRASISGLANDYYWSSTEVDLQNGMLRQMSTGASFSSNRNNARAIRPVRAFG